MDDLPDGWVWTTLSEICDINPKHDLGTVSADDSVTFVPMSAIDEVSGTIAKPEVRKYQDVRKGYTHFAEGDVLFAKITPCMENGKAAIARGLLNGIGCGTTELHVLRPLGGVLPEFIFYYVRRELFRRDAEANMTGTAGQLRVPATYMREVRVPLSPIPQQRRIASKVEELLQRNRLARSALSQVSSLIRQFRQSVLAKAFRGELTERDPNDEPVEQLTQRMHQERRTKKDEYRKPLTPTDLPRLPEEWCWVTVDQLSRVVRGASPRPAGDPKLFGGATPWITVGSLTADEQPYLRKVSQTLTETGRKRSRYVEKHTLLLTNSGATLGVPKITLVAGCINDGVAALLDVDYPTKFYLYYFLKSQTEPLRGINQGAAQPNLNTRIIREIPVPLCPLSEQQRIISKLEDLLGRASQITTTVVQGIRTCDSLYGSILRKAFRGELVPQDPDDEPASVLLERIRAQRTIGSRAKSQAISKGWR